MRAALLIAILLSFVPAFASETGRPSGENCLLATPPVGSADQVDRGGVTLRYYPPGQNMAAKYSGCQLRWVQIKDGWKLTAVVSIVSGEPVRLWAPDVSAVTCLYDNRKIVQGDPKSCPDAQSLILQ